MTGNCESCGWEGEVKHYPRFLGTEPKALCYTCARCPAGGIVDSPHQRSNNEIIRTVAICTQMILAAIEENQSWPAAKG